MYISTYQNIVPSKLPKKNIRANIDNGKKKFNVFTSLNKYQKKYIYINISKHCTIELIVSKKKECVKKQYSREYR